MKSAILMIDISKKINLYDYVSKIEKLKNNIFNYNVVYCLLNDLFIDEANNPLYDKDLIIKENVQTLINLGLNDNVKFIIQSKIPGVYELSNKLSKYVYISKIIKNEFLKTSIQNNSLNDIKLSSLINLLNLISTLIILNANDFYEIKNIKSFYSLAQKIVNNYNQTNEEKIFLPNLIINEEFLCNNLSTDGNSFVSGKFDNDVTLVCSDDELRKKVNSIYTDPNHIKVQDKGNVDNNPLFSFVDAICLDSDVKEYFDLDGIDELKNHYKNGGIGDFKIKNMVYNSFLKKFSSCKNAIDTNVISNRILKDTNEILKLKKLVD